MPHVMWRHTCGGSEVCESVPECHSCGARGVFDGWHLSMWEHVRVYHYVYGLKPFGPHRPHADRLLAPMRDLCVRCGGRTVLTLDEETWSDCPTCEGTGGVWNRPFAEVDARWREVVARWPGAVLPWVDARARRRALLSEGGPRTAQEPVREPTPQPVGGGGSRSARRSAIPRRKGYSSHGLRLADVQGAFAEAEQLLGADWRLKGRGHCRRVSLDARYSAYALKGAARSWGWVTPRYSGSVRRLMPLAIVKQAAKILGVSDRLLISREF